MRMYDYLVPSVNFMGANSISVVGERCKILGGKKALIVTDKFLRGLKGGAVELTEKYLKEVGIEVAYYDGVEPNPKDTNVKDGLKIFQDENCDMIVTVGGGSSHDCGKGIGIAATHEGDLYEQQGTYEIHMLQLRSGNFEVDGALSPVRGVEYAGGAGRNDGA